jgi:hypothetical protein
MGADAGAGRAARSSPMARPSCAPCSVYPPSTNPHPGAGSHWSHLWSGASWNLRGVSRSSATRATRSSKSKGLASAPPAPSRAASCAARSPRAHERYRRAQAQAAQPGDGLPAAHAQLLDWVCSTLVFCNCAVPSTVSKLPHPLRRVMWIRLCKFESKAVERTGRPTPPGRQIRAGDSSTSRAPDAIPPMRQVQGRAGIWGWQDAAPYAAVHPGPAELTQHVRGVPRFNLGGAPQATSLAYWPVAWS